MKYLISAVVLVIAAPAAAQTAPGPQHQGHDQHQQHQGHGQPAGHGQPCGCCADRNGNGRMDCCEGMAPSGERPAPATPPAAQPQGHDGH